MTFKWEIGIGKSVSIPFKRRIYSIALSQIVIDTKFVDELDILHVTLDPNCANGGSVVWLNNFKRILSVKSFTVSKNTNDPTTPSVVHKKWCSDCLEYYTIDLSPQILDLRVIIVDKNGELCVAKGFCVFNVR